VRPVQGAAGVLGAKPGNEGVLDDAAEHAAAEHECQAAEHLLYRTGAWAAVYAPGVSRTRRLAIVLLLNLGLVTALVVAGLAAHSLAVLAAGADYLADAAAIGVSLLAIWMAARPRGYPKATTVAALVNAGWLLILNIGIAVAALWRLAAGAHRVEGLPVLAVSAIAAAVMLAGALILGGDDGDALVLVAVGGGLRDAEAGAETADVRLVAEPGEDELRLLPAGQGTCSAPGAEFLPVPSQEARNLDHERERDVENDAIIDHAEPSVQLGLVVRPLVPGLRAPPGTSRYVRVSACPGSYMLVDRLCLTEKTSLTSHRL
jgi:Co/Zn/Cd efflux system component